MKKTDEQTLADIIDFATEPYSREILTAEEALALIRRFLDPNDEMSKK
jgi:hypothetical protein